MTANTVESVIRQYYVALDANDPQAFDTYLAEGVVFAFNDADPAVGIEAVREAVGGWKSNFRSVTHEITKVTADESQGRVGLEIVVEYAFASGETLKVKGASFLDASDGRVTSWRVYVDTSRLS